LADCRQSADREIARREAEERLTPGRDRMIQPLALDVRVNFSALEHPAFRALRRGHQPHVTLHRRLLLLGLRLLRFVLLRHLQHGNHWRLPVTCL